MNRTDEQLAELRAKHGLAAVIGKVVALTRRGKEWVGLCPFHVEQTPSFTINEAKGFFHCFGCGEHGDVIGFVMAYEVCDFRAAVARLAGDTVPPGRPARATPTDRPDRGRGDAMAAKRARAEAIWLHAAPLTEGDPVVRYLAGRALRPPPPPCDRPRPLRFARALQWFGPFGANDIRAKHRRHTGPAMVARIDDGLGRLIAVHCTWLEPDGPRRYRKLRTALGGPTAGGLQPSVPKAKLVMGSYRGGAIRLFDYPAEGMDNTALGLSEGVETALSVAALYDVPCWSGISATNLRNVALPFGVAWARLFADLDRTVAPSKHNPAGYPKGVGYAEALKAARAFQLERRRATVALPSLPAPADFNDLWRRVELSAAAEDRPEEHAL